ncbi:hypothetical protein OS493_018954 [Desmophyllum pertusum]|uniref:Uncharacterized protein n=1 Tax=Desmophyllum pertusum TaxID=174260 RepID=A0A9X0CQM1_9CNID|nr:hypothetical protein OS493_018954 [Desmophyllum pertusum]
MFAMETMTGPQRDEKLLRRTQQQAGFIYMAEGYFTEADSLMREGGLDPRELIILFPSLLSSNWKYLPSRELVELSGLVKGSKQFLAEAKQFLMQYLEETRGSAEDLGYKEEVDTALVKLYTEINSPNLQDLVSSETVVLSQIQSVGFRNMRDTTQLAAIFIVTINAHLLKALARGRGKMVVVGIIQEERRDRNFPGMRNYVVKFLAVASPGFGTSLESCFHGLLGRRIKKSAVTESTISASVSPSASTNDSVILATVTLDLSYSVFNNIPAGNTIQPTATADSQQPLQTINPGTDTTKKDCKNINWKDQKCPDANCVKMQMASMSKCIKDKPENLSFSSMDIPEQAIKLGLSLAKTIKTKQDSGVDVNSTKVVITDGMAMQVGVFDSEKYKNNTKLKMITFPNYSDPDFIGKWKNMGDSVAFPVEELPSAVKVVYSVAILPDVLGAKYLDKDEMAWQENHVPSSDISELYVVGDKLLTRKKVPRKRINSNLVSVKFVNTMTGKLLSGPLTKPALVTLKHLYTIEDHSEPTCVFYDGSAWSKDGCKVGETSSESQTVCECTHFSTFALIVKVKEKVDDSDRKMVVTVATVLGSFSILGLLICAIVAIVTNYHQTDNMRIALNIDVSLLLSQLVFFIGLSTGDNMFFSKPKTCEVVNPFVHFFELAALTWLLMEGMYYYSTLRPLFNEKNTVPIVFYFAVGWGIPIAFASACAEYGYPQFGNPGRSEFCWMFIRGGEAWFFAAPVLILVLLNLVARAFIVKEIACWEDDPDDIRIERAKYRVVTSCVLMVVIVLTWLFGVLAVNHTEDKIYHYLFIVFYTFQGLLVLLFYCVRNQEMWDHRKGKKDEEEKEKNKKLDFVYHP